MVELTKRYIVMAMATEAPFDVADPEGVFVLKPWKDPAALRALEVYRDNCYPELARDLDAWIVAIRAGAVVRGSIGKRNEPYLTAAPASVAPAARRRPASPKRSAPVTRGPAGGRKPVRKAARTGVTRAGKKAAKKRR